MYSAEFPYTDFNKVNLDWISEELKSDKQQIAQNTADIEELKAGGTVIDYEDLQNLPEINGVTLIGDKSLEDIGAASADELSDLKSAVVYVTPEKFGAKGDGIVDDTDAINAMFASGEKYFLFSKTYKIREINIIGLSNVRICGGEILVDSVANAQRFAFTLDNCNNIVWNDLHITSTNDQEAYTIPGFTNRDGAMSSNVYGTRLRKCQNITFNGLIETNVIMGVWLTKKAADEYSVNGNKNIIFNNLVLSGVHEGIHSDESNGVYINGMEFTSADVCADGYHGFYLEQNSKYFYVQNLTANVSPTAYTFFDFADYHTYENPEDFYNLAFDLRDSTITAAQFFQFQVRNKYMKAENCIFHALKELKKDGAYSTTGVYTYVDGTNQSTGDYPNIIFNDSTFTAESGLTMYLNLQYNYAKYTFNRCDLKFRINTSIGDVELNQCVIHGILVYIFAARTGSVKMYGCKWYTAEATTQSYLLTCRTTTFKMYFQDCYIVVPNGAFINNSDTASDMTFYNCVFESPAAASSFHVDNGTGVTTLNCYWNKSIMT